MNRILVVDDDLGLCELLEEYLCAEGFQICCAHDGIQGADLALGGEYDLLILDVMLPGQNGFDLLRQVRANSKLPVIMLTARGDDVDRIVGLEMGADDYLPKPFNPRELLARIRAIQRRTDGIAKEAAVAAEPVQNLVVGDLSLHGGSREVFCGGQPLELTAVEFNLLQQLLQHAGEVVSREELVQQVLKRRLSPYDRSIDVHISALRRKLAASGNAQERIKTLRGIGYLYVRSQED